MKSIIRPALLVLLVGSAFAAGHLSGQHYATERVQVSAARAAEHQMAGRLYADFKNAYGGVRFDQPNYKNVVGSIHLYKDMDFAIYQDGAVKTVKVYDQ